MVRRVEDKLAAGGRRGAAALEKPDDTAEFKAHEIREAIRRVDALVAAKAIQPVSDASWPTTRRSAGRTRPRGRRPGGHVAPGRPRSATRATPSPADQPRCPAGRRFRRKVRTDTAKFRVPGGSCRRRRRAACPR